MRAIVGLVVGFRTKDVENHDELFKWHLCVCDKTHQYLFVCGRKYDGDYDVTNLECEGLDYETSFISMRAVLFKPKLPNKPKFGCRLSPNYLRGLYTHIVATEAMSDINKCRILPGLARGVTENNAC